MADYYSNKQTEEKELAYDLRQIYANDIVGESLKDIMRARKIDDYPFYFQCLKDAKIVTFFKWKDQKINVLENNETKEKTAGEVYGNLMKKAVEVLKKYRPDFLRQTKTPEGCAAIESILNTIEEFIYERIDDANVFGSSWEDEGL